MTFDYIYNLIQDTRIRYYRNKADLHDLYAIKAANKASNYRKDARDIENSLYPDRYTLELLAVPTKQIKHMNNKISEELQYLAETNNINQTDILINKNDIKA
jgi:DNA polymerase/3'-5' exonuclease PolX